MLQVGRQANRWPCTPLGELRPQWCKALSRVLHCWARTVQRHARLPIGLQLAEVGASHQVKKLAAQLMACSCLLDPGLLDLWLEQTIELASDSSAASSVVSSNHRSSRPGPSRRLWAISWAASLSTWLAALAFASSSKAWRWPCTPLGELRPPEQDGKQSDLLVVLVAFQDTLNVLACQLVMARQDVERALQSCQDAKQLTLLSVLCSSSDRVLYIFVSTWTQHFRL